MAPCLVLRRRHPDARVALAQLSALVQDNTLGLLALTRLLNPAGVAEALGQHILSQFDGGQPDRICYQGLWLQLAKPTVGFEVGPGEGVNIAVTLCWQIVGFGPTPRCENTPVAPEGSATLSSTVHIQLRVNQHGVEQHRFSLGPARLLIRETWRCVVPEPPPEMSERSEMVTSLINMMGVFD